MSLWREPLPHQQKWREEFSDEKIRKNLSGNIVPIGKNLAGTSDPIGTRTGIKRNWVKKGSGIENSLEFSGIPLRIHNQVVILGVIFMVILSGRGIVVVFIVVVMGFINVHIACH
jgi:hypothetical protein